MYGYNFFHIGFEIIFYDYSQLCSHLEYLVVDVLVAKDKIPSTIGQPIITESFVDQGDPMHIKEHICLHLMRMNVSMNTNYNEFTCFQVDEQLDVVQGAMYKCKLFNNVASTY
jgi:hypothetical protein